MDNYQKVLIAVALFASAYFKLSVPLAISVVGLFSYSLVSRIVAIKEKNQEEFKKLTEFSSKIGEIELKVNHLVTRDATKEMVAGFGARK